MLTHKASGIGTGRFVPFKNIQFDANMKIVADFNTSIDKNALPLKQSR
jgi:hypothetical protein